MIIKQEEVIGKEKREIKQMAILRKKCGLLKMLTSKKE